MKANPFRRRTKIRIAGLGLIRSEMSRVYRAGVCGELSWTDASKAAHILHLIAQLENDKLIDVRVKALEARLDAALAAGGFPRLMNGNGHTSDAVILEDGPPRVASSGYAGASHQNDNPRMDTPG